MNKTFAELLREYRGDRSQLKVATLLDISPSYYSELERGLKQPSYKILAQIILKSGMGKDYWIEPDSYYDDENSRVSPNMHEAPPCVGEHVRKPDKMKVSEIIVWLSELRVHLENIEAILSIVDRYSLYYSLTACQHIVERKQ